MTHALRTALGRLAIMMALLVAFAFPALAVEEMSAAEARAAVEAGTLVLIDVRTPQEWKETGVGDVAQAISLQDRQFGPKLQALVDANPGARLGFICATGSRSNFVATELARRGLTGLVDVPEGMEGSRAGQGWLKSGLPVKQL